MVGRLRFVRSLPLDRCGMGNQKVWVGGYDNARHGITEIGAGSLGRSLGEGDHIEELFLYICTYIYIL